MSAPRPSARPEPALAGPLLPDVAAPAAVQAALDRRLDRASRAPIAVGFSGGGDSLALLLAALAWAEAAGRPVLALTVDHGLQPASASWTAQAGRTAEALGADFRALPWLGDKPASGLPAAARRARHALLAEAAREAGARVILLGHTADDVLEAQLMRQAGSSVGEPAEWSPSPVWPQGRGVFLLRPLLSVRRAALRAMLAGTGLDWIEDPANDDPRYSRARARRIVHEPHEHAPARSAPDHVGGQEGHDVRVVRVVRGSSLSLDQAWLAGESRIDACGVISIDRETLLAADPDAARRFVAMACVCAGGGERLPRTERVERLLARITSGAPFTATLCGARIEAGQEVRFMRDAGEALRRGMGRLRLDPDAPTVWDGRFLVSADQPGVTVGPLRGLALRLPPDERRALKRAPPAARAALPVFQCGEIVTCPILAQATLASARALIGERLAGACGQFAREGNLSCASDGERAKGALS